MPRSATDVDLPESNAAPSSTFAIRFALALLLTLAISQWLVAFSAGEIWQRIICIAVLLGSGVFAFAPMPLNKRLGTLAGFGLLAFANLVGIVATAPQPFSMRLLLQAALFGYASLALVGICTLISRRIAAGLLLSAFTATIGLVAIEATIQYSNMPAVSRNVVRWEGGTVPHPVLEESYAPNSTARTIYVSNPRDYFRPSDPRAQQWRLGSNHAGSAARLLFPDSPIFDGVRVEIDRADVPTPWHVQLTSDGLSVRKGERYTLSFKVRADKTRPFSYGVSQAHPPWENLGWYRNIEVGTDWTEQRGDFRATGTDDAARFTFDLGADLSAVEIRELRVERPGSDLNIIREPTPEYSVSYRFNDQGCRGPDYAVPKPTNVRRILVLGDSYALGVGVHEEDTFSARLQAMLGAASAETPDINYEVINCGVSGYSTVQERQLFEILGPVYQPDIVILAMVLNDDSSWRSDVANGYFHSPGRLEELSLLWSGIQFALHEGRKPPPDFLSSLDEVRKLQKLAEERNAKLVVFSFRNHPLTMGAWGTLASTMSKGLAGTGVPWLDIGDRIVDDATWQRLLVHPDGDLHPNEIVHQSAAEQVAELLRVHGFLE